MSFPFHRFSAELVLEVISFAASPDADCLTSIFGRHGTYKDALALASVCYDFRQATMPHLLRTVILSTSRDVQLFIQALLRQCWFRRNFPHLVLDYKHYVRRLWCTESVHAFYDNHDFETILGYDLFYDLICNVRDLGLGIHAFHLILNGLVSNALPSFSLSHFSQSPPSQYCTRITLAGPLVRWDLLTSTLQGIRFLAGITHLTLWITDLTSSLPTHPRIPSWAGTIPFHLLRSLGQLELILVPDWSQEELDQAGYYGEYHSPHPLEVLVLTQPSPRLACRWLTEKVGGAHQPETRVGMSQGYDTTKSGAEIIEEWIRSADPITCGVVYLLDGIPRTATANINMTLGFESHFLEGWTNRDSLKASGCKGPTEWGNV